MIIKIIAGVVGAFLAFYIWKTKSRDRIYVSRITSPRDSAIEGAIELYSSLFVDDGTNYSVEELLELLGDDPKFTIGRHIEAENIILVAKLRKEVIGFLICHFYVERRKAIISYLGINSQIIEAKRSASKVLFNKLKTVLLKHEDECDFIFFDLQGVDSSLPQSEKLKRKARPILFKRIAKRLGVRAYLLQFNYICPKVSMSDKAREYPFTLMCIPVHGQLAPKIPKKTVMEFLIFIYLDCYGGIYSVSDPKFKAYNDYLKEKLKQYEETLPDAIPTE
jgi:hypothetical protein